MYTASLKRSENYKAQPYQYASSSKQILKAKTKPFPPYTQGKGYIARCCTVLMETSCVQWVEMCTIMGWWGTWTERVGATGADKYSLLLGRGSGLIMRRVDDRVEGVCWDYRGDMGVYETSGVDGCCWASDNVMMLLPEKWLTFSQGLRNANHTQTLDLADINGRFVYEDNLIQRSQADTKFQKDYKAKYKKMKAKLALLKASPSSSQNPKIFQPKNKANDEITVGKSHARNGEWVNITIRKNSLPESQLSMIPLEPTETYNTPKSSKDSKAESLTSLPPLKIFRELHQALRILYCMICKREDHKTSDHEMYTASLKRSKNYKAQPYQYASSSKQILKAKAKPFPPCTSGSPFGTWTVDAQGGYGSINCRGVVFTKVAFVNGLKYNLISISQLCDAKYIVQFDDKQGIIFNANKEIILITPRRNDVYVLDMSSLTPNGAFFFPKASESVNWLWHKRLSHLNFKNINKLAKQNKILGLSSLVYSKDKPCTTCEKGKHHRASFKTKQNFSIRKCLHLLHMDLFRPNFSSPYTPEQNGVAERKNKTLIKAARTMLNGSVLSKHFWTEAVRIACYTQNISIIIKRHDKTPYEIFRERIPDISYFHVFGCLVFIHNHKEHLGKFNAKADDGYFLGYSFVSKAFRVFNTRRQQVEETYHVTFNESMEAIRFTNTLVDKIGMDDSSRYPPDEFL
ncbi:retrovirus-related pol polyprotein from transposon TNT 1-94 [Tanacetum coccineum]